MALSIEELELQSTTYLPAREVMTGFGGGHSHCGGGFFLQDGLVNTNVNVHDINILNGINILTGHDSDGVDLDNVL